MQHKMPIPRPGVPGDLPRYPFDALEVGDTIYVPLERSSVRPLWEVVRKRMKRRPGKVFRVSLAEGGGTLIERTA